MWRNVIRHLINIRALISNYKFFEDVIAFIVYKRTTLFDLVDENLKLLKVVFKGWKNINVIPGNTCDNSNMRKKEMKLRSSFYNTCRILITFTHDNRSISNIDRLIKTFES